MKLTRNQMIALGIGLVFIVIGLVQALTDIQIDKKVMDMISFVLLMVAAFMLFSGRRKSAGNEAEKKHESEIKDQDEIPSMDEGKDQNQD